MFKLYHSFVHFCRAPLGVCSTKVDDSKPCQLLHSGRGYWISRLAE